MRIGLYNRHLGTLGGGERHSLAIAALLSRGQPVDVLSHTPVSREAIGARLRLDLGNVRLRVVPERPAAALGELSAEYDFFINASNGDFISPQAHYSALLVYFPVPAPTEGPAAFSAGLRRQAARTLGRRFLLPTWRSGVYGEGAGGSRLLAPEAVIELPEGAGGAAVRFRLRSALPAVQQATVLVDGAPVLALAAGDGWQPCRVQIPRSGRGPHTLAILAGSAARSAPFALELDGWAVERLGHALYRRAFARYLPGWDLRLRNPQPADLLGVVRGYTLLWANSRYTQGWINRYWGMESELLYPPVDIEPFAAAAAPARGRAGYAGQGAAPARGRAGYAGQGASPAHPSPPYILSVGRFFAGQHNKQHLTLIHAFRRMVDGGLTGWELRLVGGLTPGRAHAAYLERVRAAAAGYPIRIETDLPFEQLVERYGGAAVYWHATGYGADEGTPMQAEHFGITTVEAMAAGCVPVVIARGGQPELVTHGVDGFLWRTLDELCDCTLRLLRDEGLRAQMAAAAQTASRRFDGEHFAAALQASLRCARIPAMPDEKP